MRRPSTSSTDSAPVADAFAARRASRTRLRRDFWSRATRDGGSCRGRLARQVGLEAEGADLDDVAIVEPDLLDCLAVDARTRPTAAIAQPPAVGGPHQDTVDRRHLGRHQTEVALALRPSTMTSASSGRHFLVVWP